MTQRPGFFPGAGFQALEDIEGIIDAAFGDEDILAGGSDAAQPLTRQG